MVVLMTTSPPIPACFAFCGYMGSALEISRGSATFPPVTTGPSGRISGAAGAAMLEEEMTPGSALPLELSTAEPASSAGAATCSAESVRCAVSGCASATDPPRIAAILFTGALAATGDLPAFDELALTVTAGVPGGNVGVHRAVQPARQLGHYI